MIININTIEQLQSSILEQIGEKNLFRTFGQSNDSIELTILDINNNIAISDEKFTDYTPYYDGNGQINSIDINYEQVLKDYGLSSGRYKLNFSFQRKLLIKGTRKHFYITEISPSRTEIRFKSDKLSDDDFISLAQELISISNTLPFFKDVNLSFGEGSTALITNVQIDDNSCLLKLYNPLNNNISVNSRFRIYEDIINPIEAEVDLGPSITQDVGTDLRGPNFEISYNDELSVPSEFRTYDQLLNNGAVTSSFNNLQHYLSGSIPLDLEFDNPDTLSGYHFENFIHYSSATERLKNFKYKLELIESYSSSIALLGNITGSVSESAPTLDNIKIFNDKTDRIVQNLDYYERYLYFESGAYAWPKTDDGRYPHINAKVNSSAAVTWFGATVNDYDDEYYGGQMYSASMFDDCNPYYLGKTIPPDIRNNPHNVGYVLFTEMIAQHFDGIWAYIDSITDKYQAHSGINDGISKELVFNALTEKGIKAYSQFENS